MTAYERGQAMPYPGYYFQNLSGNLSRQRARLARLERAAQAARHHRLPRPARAGSPSAPTSGWSRSPVR